jgi:hypothetical protein
VEPLTTLEWNMIWKETSRSLAAISCEKATARSNASSLGIKKLSSWNRNSLVPVCATTSAISSTISTAGRGRQVQSPVRALITGVRQ